MTAERRGVPDCPMCRSDLTRATPREPKFDARCLRCGVCFATTSTGAVVVGPDPGHPRVSDR